MAEIERANKVHINAYKMAHMVGVAEYMRERADAYGLDGNVAYMTGLLHDIGYLEGRAGHEKAGAEILTAGGVAGNVLEAVKHHADNLCKVKDPSPLLILLEEADLSVNAQGFRVGFDKRKEDISKRYGKNTPEMKEVEDSILFIKNYQKTHGIPCAVLHCSDKDYRGKWVGSKNDLTDEEKQFIETNYAPLIAKKFLAWDEIEDLGYRFFEDGYIDKFKPSEKALYGDGLVPEPKIYDIAHRMQGGEDIREELAKALIKGASERAVRIIEVGEVGKSDIVAEFGEKAVAVTFGNAKKQISYEELGTAFLGLFENEYKDIEQARAMEDAASGHDDQKPETEAEQLEAQTNYPAVYGHTLDYAIKHGEVPEYRVLAKVLAKKNAVGMEISFEGEYAKLGWICLHYGNIIMNMFSTQDRFLLMNEDEFTVLSLDVLAMPEDMDPMSGDWEFKIPDYAGELIFKKCSTVPLLKRIVRQKDEENQNIADELSDELEERD